MTVQEALTKAREGGYQHAFKHRDPGLRAVVIRLRGFHTIHVDDFFLDPEFWRALGRTLGWQHERAGEGSGNVLSISWRKATLLHHFLPRSEMLLYRIIDSSIQFDADFCTPHSCSILLPVQTGL